MTDERADYMMEAFLDEQNTLIRPLVARKLHLVRTLDERAGIVEKILEEKRKSFLQSVVVPSGGRGGHLNVNGVQLSLIETLEDELEQLSEEKVNILMQLMDLVKRPYDTILEVESVLQSAAATGGAANDGDVVMNGGGGRGQQQQQQQQAAGGRTSYASRSTAGAAAVVAATGSPPEEELWCNCRMPDDGRQMVACDNAKCDLVWWHTDCIERYIAENGIGAHPPVDDGANWSCPVCIAQEIVAREEHAAGSDKMRRRRRQHVG